MATCYNHVIHARNRPWGGRLKAEWVLGDPRQGLVAHLAVATCIPHGCAWGFNHQEQKSKEAGELPSHQGLGPSSSYHHHRHPAQSQDTPLIG